MSIKLKLLLAIILNFKIILLKEKLKKKELLNVYFLTYIIYLEKERIFIHSKNRSIELNKNVEIKKIKINTK